MPRDSAATKARLLDAASAEFAAYGLAGARVDRIAEAANANKQRIYAYFGNKEQLFDAVIDRVLAVGAETVPFDAEDLPGVAGQIFDNLVAHPDLMRLLSWKLLERPGATDQEAATYTAKTTAVAAAQEQGRVEPELGPEDLVAFVLALTQAWFSLTGGMSPTSGSDPWSTRRLARHRDAVVDAVRRITTPHR
ncbi:MULTISPECIES: TetR family transcriptional regulator [unclassified Streptomyces]|uniref:TetR family transcriptional regulator n=1 Tax=unclassified Streptomyces TaxID=2593676 RepID=UPI002DD938CF|nr:MULTISPECIES: TetR family transcriptional regulator [unclassified Streptomyces]WSF86971.1 TetR family transcriptional regulator [Streptomyces sp. NBC_01744]WSC36788.1 TetR family transcriptional regulator [Streptomyces sp. NBC_01763]WSC44886.1 TetR family transcriptional regulator [Streptomyces sp. NBC_01762]WSC56134.1 TetR family transcriptional regulator [Streptomyces sp. NBC_01761]WSD24473.1 TetR family transcriptional regulator [Streptomyces sp. NBC_01751]